MSNQSQALVECPLVIKATYNCSNPYPNCTSTLGFQFSSIWVITQNIYNACPTDWRIFDPQTGAISEQACEELFGPSWTLYPDADIWSRLTTWKFPLLQLVAIFPKQPLSLKVGAFTIFHLLGDPISTLHGLILKFSTCQSRAEYWKGHLSDDLRHLIEDQGLRPRYTNLEKKWKALAMITDSYDEWGQSKGDDAKNFLYGRLTSDQLEVKDKIDLLEICQKTGNALAADRSTKFFPVIVAEAFFIGTVGIAFGRTEAAAEEPNPTTFINIEAHSIAFTALYFWLIPAVLLASVIGVSQTENAFPRILRRLQEDIKNKFPLWTTSLPNDHLTSSDVEGRPDAPLRERSGGIYTWQPMGARANVSSQTIPVIPAPNMNPPSRGFRSRSCRAILRLTSLKRGSSTLPHIMAFSGFSAAFLISYLIPPSGFECRHIAQILIYVTWLVSFLLDFVPWGIHYRWRFYYTFVKDIVLTIATMGGIIVTQVGVFNRCDCYTLWGKVGLALPEISWVAGTLVHRISTVYPAIAFLCIGLELVVFPAIVLRQYGHAARVFLQRDDEVSNMNPWHAVLDQWAKVKGRRRRGSSDPEEELLAQNAAFGLLSPPVPDPQ